MTCANNGMTSFTASDALTYLECQNNNMTTLDLSIYTKLNTLKCYNNRLSTLDASNMSIVEFDGYYGLFCGNQKNSSGGNQTLTLTLAAKHLSEWNNALKDDINNVNVVLQ